MATLNIVVHNSIFVIVFCLENVLLRGASETKTHIVVYVRYRAARGSGPNPGVKIAVTNFDLKLILYAAPTINKRGIYYARYTAARASGPNSEVTAWVPIVPSNHYDTARVRETICSRVFSRGWGCSRFVSNS